MNLEMPPSMHNVAAPVVVKGNQLILNQQVMFPYMPYRFRFLDCNMVAILHLDPDRVELYEEV